MFEIACLIDLENWMIIILKIHTRNIALVRCSTLFKTDAVIAITVKEMTVSFISRRKLVIDIFRKWFQVHYNNIYKVRL